MESSHMVTTRVLAAAAALSLAVTACGQTSSSQPAQSAAAKPGAASGAAQGAVNAQGRRIVIATGGTGGVFYPLGNGLTKMIEKYMKIEVVPQATAASVGNFQVVKQ